MLFRSQRHAQTFYIISTVFVTNTFIISAYFRLLLVCIINSMTLTAGYRYIYTMWTKVLGRLHITPTGTFMTSHSKSIGINMELVPFCSCNSFNTSAKFSTTYWSVTLRIFAHSFRRAFVSTDTEVGQEGLARISVLVHPKGV